MKHLTIALIGNPNTGKTTLFNALTGSSQKIGNWPGVTVEKKEGVMKHSIRDIHVVDLPGIYSLSAYSQDERVSSNYLLSREASLIVNIVDASNLERNLYLTTQLIELKVPMLIVLNRIDIAERQNKIIDAEMLSSHLGCPVIGSIAVKKGEIDKIKQAITGYIDNIAISPRKIEYPDEIERIIDDWAVKLKQPAVEFNVDTRWVSLKILERDVNILHAVNEKYGIQMEEINSKILQAENLLHESIDIIIADYRYAFIQGIARKCVSKKTDRKEITDSIDRIVLSRFIALPSFLVAMYIIFWVTISLGGAFIDFFQIFSGAIFIDGSRMLLTALHIPEWLTFIISDGAGAGIQAVSAFIPIIFTMFFMLSMLEDSGYMARAAFIMDRFMRIIGLPGKSFVPLMIGFGCSVPAVMASRTLEEKRDRIMTIFITPFMSCGARLSVYILFAAAFFPDSPGLIVFSLYLAGMILAILTGIYMKKTVFPGEPSFFVMELPTYNFPRIRHIIIHTWIRMKLFLFGAGKIIVIAVMLLTLLNSVRPDFSFGKIDKGGSLLALTAKKILPVFKPFGIEESNWPAAVALFSGPFAKEAIIGTLNTLYLQSDVNTSIRETDTGIGYKILYGFMTIPVNIKNSIVNIGGNFKTSNDPKEPGSITDESLLLKLKAHFKNGANAYAYLLFILIYFPCIATCGAVFRESGIAVAVAQVVYMTSLAWVVSVLFYQFAFGHSLFWIAVSLVILSLIMLVFFIAGKIIVEK